MAAILASEKWPDRRKNQVTRQVKNQADRSKNQAGPGAHGPGPAFLV
jgi:hypothetical protein